ncbi:response regulator transcription factor [Adhaeribacter soli]|uniref:Response regulator transcription factor n=1 Tax=Adhaeribacter soli TaxID=2607655 RepID=A0A5N1IJ21_9BACT|nr:response regulator transcription factor [Adhaeribacter soli]KAA9325665.1 response regulator transcription factor [Adhaeribacter soli]
MFRILLVEDDPNLGFLVQDSLEAKGYQVVLCEDGATGLETSAQETFDLCILDVMLPALDGFTLAKEIRIKNAVLPIIFLTAKARQEDRILGLTIGADDYLTKPFSLEELHLRLKAILKRVQPNVPLPAVNNDQQLVFGQSSLDIANQLLTVKGVSQTLTLKETEVLRLLAQHKNAIVKRDTILKTVWEDNGYFVARSMDVFISRLRKYLKPDESLRIASVHGVGYKLEITLNR